MNNSIQSEETMSFKEKNIVVSLATLAIVTGVYLNTVSLVIQDGGVNSAGAFRLWGVITGSGNRFHDLRHDSHAYSLHHHHPGRVERWKRM